MIYLNSMAIYSNLITQIDTILKGISNVAKVYAHPQTKLEAYPAVIFYPSSFENSFNSNSDNLKIYKFKMFVVCASKQTNMAFLFKQVLANTIDAILAEFDEKWSMTSIDGHRCWIKIDSGDWGADEKQDGSEAYAEMNIEVKVLTNN